MAKRKRKRRKVLKIDGDQYLCHQPVKMKSMAQDQAKRIRKQGFKARVRRLVRKGPDSYKACKGPRRERASAK